MADECRSPEQSYDSNLTPTNSEDCYHSDKPLENSSDAHVVRYVETELKKSQQLVKTKLDTIDKSLNSLYCRTLESIMKIYKSNKTKSCKKPWEEFREAADHLSEMHKYMKTELVELYALSQRRGSLACSRALLDSLCPITTSAALPGSSTSDPQSPEVMTQGCSHLTSKVNNCKNRYVSSALIASQLKFDSKNRNNLKRVAPMNDQSLSVYRSSSPDYCVTDKNCALSTSGAVDSSSDDEDELLEIEIKRRRTDHEWR